MYTKKEEIKKEVDEFISGSDGLNINDVYAFPYTHRALYKNSKNYIQ